MKATLQETKAAVAGQTRYVSGYRIIVEHDGRHVGVLNFMRCEKDLAHQMLDKLNRT